MAELSPSEEEENKRLYEELRSLCSQTVRKRFLSLNAKHFAVDHDTVWANGNVRIMLSEYENEDTTLCQLKESGRLDAFIDKFSFKLWVGKYSWKSVSKLAKQLSSCKCQYCGKYTGDVTGIVVRKAFPRIIANRIKTELLIGCAKCLRKKLFKAQCRTLLLGWIALPFGVFQVLYVAIRNFRGTVDLGRKDRSPGWIREYAGPFVHGIDCVQSYIKSGGRNRE